MQITSLAASISSTVANCTPSSASAPSGSRLRLLYSTVQPNGRSSRASSLPISPMPRMPIVLPHSPITPR